MGCALGKEVDVYFKNDFDCLKNTPVTLVIGIPGAGSKTATDELSKLTGHLPIHPGDLIRNIEIMKGIEISRDELTVELIKDEMLKNRDATGFIVSGFPRNTKVLDMYLKMLKIPEKIVLLEVDECVAKGRLMKKFKEIGKSSIEMQLIEKIINDAVPALKKIEKRFDKDSIVKVNVSSDHLMEFYKSIGYASQYIVDMTKIDVTKIDVQNETEE